jgi:hypothetical protein
MMGLFSDSFRLPRWNVTYSSNIPCSANNITVSFKPSIVLRTTCAPQINITNLIGTSSTSSVTSVSVEANGSPLNLAMSVISWNAELGTLVLAVLKDLESAVHTISFVVTNANCQSSGSNAAISVKTSRCGSPVIKDGTLGSVLSTVGRAFNMDDVAHIGQSTPFPCAANTISVSLSITVSTFSACDNFLTLTGLTGSLTDDTSTLAMKFVSNVASPTVDESLTGEWTKSTGTLIFKVPLDTEASVTYVTTFTLTNPAVHVNCPSVTMSFQCDVSDTDTDSVTLLNPVETASRPLCITDPEVCGVRKNSEKLASDSSYAIN